MNIFTIEFIARRVRKERELLDAFGDLISAASNLEVTECDMMRASYYDSVVLVKTKKEHLRFLNRALKWALEVHPEFD